MQHGMPKPRALFTCSLIEVARILVKKRRQYGAADQNVTKTVSGIGPKPFAIGRPTLAKIRRVARLLRGGKKCDSGSRDGIADNFDCESELQLGCDGYRLR